MKHLKTIKNSLFIYLQVGDQVVSVNGYRVNDAVHAELVHYITSQSRLKIKVRRKLHFFNIVRRQLDKQQI